MRYLKTFESYESTVKELNRMPKSGDFVQLKYTDEDKSDDNKHYINTHIGEVVELKHIFSLIVKYIDDIKYSYGYWINSDTSHIVDFAPTKEELELKLKANKYNL